MRTRFIARLLAADDTLLAWAEVWADATPQGGRASCPFFATPGTTRFTIEVDGTVEKLAVHWPDLDVARVRPLTTTPVIALQIFDFLWLEPVWMVPGAAGVVLPAVTVRAPVVLTPPTGMLAAITNNQKD